MKIIDKIYGSEEIKEQILIDLINSREIQRLKGISQFGLPQDYYHKPIFSRYEHSIGTMVLLRRLGAELKEQIAGLLHDVSHTAFSHVIDWVVGDPTKEDYQDTIHSDFIKNSEISKILEKYNFDYKEISNIENFTLLERPAPSLCADRFDYSIREFNYFLAKSKIKKIIGDIVNYDRIIAFKSRRIAKIFAENYAKCQNEHWAGVEARTRFYILSNTLKRALKDKIISFEDLRKTDEYVMNMLENSKDEEIVTNLKLLKNGFEIKESKEGIGLQKKFRHIDPEILVNNKIISLSELSKDYKTFILQEKEKAKNLTKIRIIKK